MTIGWVTLLVGIVTILLGVGLILLIVLRKKQPLPTPPIDAPDLAAASDAPNDVTPSDEVITPEPATTPAAEPRPAVDTAFPTAPDDNAPTQ